MKILVACSSVMAVAHAVAVRGVNLGGWLVLERYIRPSIMEVGFGPDVFPDDVEGQGYPVDQWTYATLSNSLGGKKNNAKGRVVAQLAQRHRVTNAQVLLRWALQHKVRVIPGATSRAHIQQNLNLSCFALSADEMALLQGSAKPRTFAKYR